MFAVLLFGGSLFMGVFGLTGLAAFITLILDADTFWLIEVFRLGMVFAALSRLIIVMLMWYGGVRIMGSLRDYATLYGLVVLGSFLMLLATVVFIVLVGGAVGRMGGGLLGG
jgi:hypothetical protein